MSGVRLETRNAARRATSRDDSSLLQKALDPRTVLKVLSFGMLFFGSHILVAPNHFHDFYFVGEVDAASLFYLKFWGLREFMCSVAFALLSHKADSELCQWFIILVFISLSPAQIHEMATNPALNEFFRSPLLVIQGFFAVYMGASIIVSRSK